MTTLFDDLPLPGTRHDPTAALPRIAVSAAADDAWVPGEAPDEPEHAAPAGADAAALVEGLNPQQREAVLHEGGPLLIVAGAGSGKTRVLTHRIAHLIATGRARPGEILAITFTNKAAAEMRERVEQLVGPAARFMWVSTFHSACVRILRREAKTLGLRSSFSIYDAADSLRLVTLVARELDLDPKRYAPKAIAHRIGSLKDELVDPDTFAAQVGSPDPDARPGQGPSDFDQVVAQVYTRYQERLRQAHALDFDDIIMTTVNLLQAFPAVAEHYRRRFRHVLVDEYQDTNHAQYVLVRELAGAEGDRVSGELTVVGDSDQSIYAFRGASIRNILEFEADYPRARTILLEQNYRSTQNILTAANAVISRNEGRRPKRLWTDSGEGEKVVGWVADSEHGEAQFVADEIDRLAAEGVRPRDVAIFYRTNAQSRALEEVLIRVGLPYRVVGGTRFYERREIKDAVAYLRAIANPDDDVNVRRILNVPKRGIGDRAEAQLAVFAERERISFGAAVDRADDVPGLATRSLNAVTAFAGLMRGLRELAASGAGPAEVLGEVLDRTGYLAELRASEDPQDAQRVENLAELHAVASEFAEAEPEGDLADFLERVSLVADADQIPTPDEGADDDGAAQAAAEAGVITLMTIHTAKGLEFPVVFVTGLEDGTFPHQRSLADPEELAEERRLAYVSMTRARERLYLTRAAVRTAWGVPNEFPPSRFLDDVPEEVMDWRRSESSMQTLRSPGSRWGAGRSGGSRSGAGWSRDRSHVRDSEVSARKLPSTGATFGSATPRPAGAVPNLDVGDRVTHDSYGLGTVVAVEGAGQNAVAKIDFGSEGTKRLLLRYSPVTKL